MSEQVDRQGALDKISFEAAFAELEAVVQQLEEEELSLEEMIAVYARGQALARACQERLDQAELRVEQLRSESAPGETDEGGLLC
jgi:exodeoxyribonuclease VII small subunit